VYIEEIPSGVRTITGVSTSIAVFVGWATRGPIDRAQRILSWQDYERHYGGLHRQSALSYAVNHFFANGGQDAYVVRLAAKTPDPSPATPGAITLDGVLTLTAKNPGAWSGRYGIATRRRSDDATRFRLQVVFFETPTAEITVESFENLSMLPGDRRAVESVVNTESAFVNAAVVGGATTPPNDTGAPSPQLAGGADGTILEPNTAGFESDLNPATATAAIRLLDRVDLFNLVIIAGQTNVAPLALLQAYCREKRAFLIVDCEEGATLSSLQPGPPGALTGADSTNAAFYFPWIMAPDPLQENRLRAFPPSGFVAGLYARTDATRGVFKAPAGIDASLTGANGVRRPLTDRENGTLNPLGINCVRQFAVYGTVVWGARTINGNDERGSEWKYIPVRRVALFLEESLYRGTKWVVFEPNDEPLWAQIRLNIGAFMQSLFRQGAFAGRTPREAYFVKCDRETTTQDDVNRGIVNILVGFAPLKPAEFVIIKIQQMAGQIQT
jgi:hypothetical protein